MVLFGNPPPQPDQGKADHGIPFAACTSQAGGVRTSKQRGALKIACTTACALIRILVVDDNEYIADTIANIIRLWGHEARIATDGRAGFEEACDFHPDLVLMDIGLPQLNGFVAARLVRATLGQAVTLVALTAYSSDAFRAEARQAGFDYYLVKPAGLSDLQRIVSEVSERKAVEDTRSKPCDRASH